MPGSAKGVVEVLVREGDLARLDAVGMDYELVRRTATGVAGARPAGLLRQPGETPDGEYRLGTARYESDLRALVSGPRGQRPRPPAGDADQARILGQTTYAVEIATDVATPDGRPVVMHDGMHHCREWPSGEMPMMWAHELLESYGTDADITAHRRRHPHDRPPAGEPRRVRPHRRGRRAHRADQRRRHGRPRLPLRRRGPGRHAPQEPACTSATWARSRPPARSSAARRSAPPSPTPTASTSTATTPSTGATSRGSSSQPVRPDLPRPRAVQRARDPQRPRPRARPAAVTHITHHTSGQQMLIPWGRDPERDPQPRLAAHEGHRRRDARRLHRPDGTAYAGNGYDPTQAFNLYPTSGTSRDWGHACTRTIIYTFEHGTEFHGPLRRDHPGDVRAEPRRLHPPLAWPRWTRRCTPGSPARARPAAPSR